jgi:hypothetical protein
MTERPLLFSAPMVRGMRENRKTVTRRTRGLDKINTEPDRWEYLGFEHGYHRFRDVMRIQPDIAIRCPYGVAGDRLWTREAWATCEEWNLLPPAEIAVMWLRKTETFPVWYLADGPNDPGVSGVGGKVRPGIFLPKRFSRDTLEVISARPERLHAITEADAIAEGVDLTDELTGCSEDLNGSYVKAYSILWEIINGGGAWAKNFWVWRVEFRRLMPAGEFPAAGGPE